MERDWRLAGAMISTAESAPPAPSKSCRNVTIERRVIRPTTRIGRLSMGNSVTAVLILPMARMTSKNAPRDTRVAALGCDDGGRHASRVPDRRRSSGPLRRQHRPFRAFDLTDGPLRPWPSVEHGDGKRRGGRPDSAQRSAGRVGPRSGPGWFPWIDPQAIVGTPLETIEGYRPPPEVREDYPESYADDRFVESMSYAPTRTSFPAGRASTERQARRRGRVFRVGGASRRVRLPDRGLGRGRVPRGGGTWPTAAVMSPATDGGNDELEQ